jgi:opacity protein-like surface antigen
MTLTKFIRTGAAALGALAVATQAYAADIYSGGGGGLKDVAPIAPPPIWTGFYAGIHLGVAWTDFGKNNNNNFFDQCAGEWGCSSGYNVSGGDPFWTNGAAFNTRGQSETDAFGGGQFGYNWQPAGWQSWLLGIEVDIDGLATNNERTVFPTTFGSNGGAAVVSNVGAFTVRREGGFAGDVTGRLGYTWGPALIYAKGGFAWLDARLKIRGTIYDTNTQSYAIIDNGNGWNNDDTLTGWTVGAGIEWLLSPSWSAKIEYLHFDFGSNNRTWNPYITYADGTVNNFNSWRFNNDITADTVKLGINYHLNNNYPTPLK